MSVNELLTEVLHLPPSERANLVEKIIESIAADIDPEIEKAHLAEIRKRREQPSALISGDQTLQQARGVI